MNQSQTANNSSCQINANSINSSHSTTMPCATAGSQLSPNSLTVRAPNAFPERSSSAQILSNHHLSPYVTPPPQRQMAENSQLLHANYGTVRPTTGMSPSPNATATSSTHPVAPLSAPPAAVAASELNFDQIFMDVISELDL